MKRISILLHDDEIEKVKRWMEPGWSAISLCASQPGPWDEEHIPVEVEFDDYAD